MSSRGRCLAVELDDLVARIIAGFKQADETRDEVGEEEGMDDLLFLTVEQAEEVLRKHLVVELEEEKPS